MSAIVVFPCNGATRIGSTFTRLAAFRARELRPAVLLGNSAGVMARVPDQLALVRAHATVVIEGCLLNCGEEILREQGLAPAASVKLFEVMAEERISIMGAQWNDLGENGLKLVEAMARRVVAAADRLLETGQTAAVPLPEDKLREVRERPPARKAPEGPKKVYLFPCVGLLRAEGTVARNAAYRVTDERKGQAKLGCAPPAFAEVAPQVDFSNYHVLALEGCANRCVTKIITAHAYRVDRTIVVADVLAHAGAGVEGLPADAPDAQLEQAVQVICDACFAEIDAQATPDSTGE